MYLSVAAMPLAWTELRGVGANVYSLASMVMASRWGAPSWTCAAFWTYRVPSTGLASGAWRDTSSGERPGLAAPELSAVTYHPAMDRTYDRGGQPDGWDIWQGLSYFATALSVASVVTGGKKGKELGQVGTVVGLASSALHKATAPPRCDRCRCRMRPLGPAWVCSSCGFQKQ